MLCRLVGWIREGSAVGLVAATLALAPATAKAGWLDDMKDTVRVAKEVFHPGHAFGKYALGSALVAGGVIVAVVGSGVVLGAAAGVAILGGANLLLWSAYELREEARTASGPGSNQGRLDETRSPGWAVAPPTTYSGAAPAGTRR